jgi:hypothetical protein
LTEFLINTIKQNYEFDNNIAITIIKQQPIDTKIWKPKQKKSKTLILKTKPEKVDYQIQSYFD